MTNTFPDDAGLQGKKTQAENGHKVEPQRADICRNGSASHCSFPNMNAQIQHRPYCSYYTTRSDYTLIAAAKEVKK